MARLGLPLIAAFVAGCAVCAVAADAAASRIRVRFDAGSRRSVITIRTTDGRARWTDVLRGLARARGFDDEALAGLGPSGSFPITGWRSFLVLRGINAALSPEIALRVVRAPPGAEGHTLRIEVDRAALLASQRRFRGWLKERLRRVLAPFARPREYGLRLDKDWRKAPADKPLVILVHGLNSSPERLKAILTNVRALGFPCGVFSYPNDQPIARSAQALSTALRKLARSRPRRRVTLLTASMGGLVSRAVIDDPDLDPGNVRRLIMVAPPNHGSNMAHFGFSGELWEHLGKNKAKAPLAMLYQPVEKVLLTGMIS